SNSGSNPGRSTTYLYRWKTKSVCGDRMRLIVAYTGSGKHPVSSIHDLSPHEATGNALHIGRNLPDRQNNKIHVPDQHVSRDQWKLTFDGGKPHLEDLESSHGTFVNGKQVIAAKIGGTIDLQHGAVVSTSPRSDGSFRLHLILDREGTLAHLIDPKQLEKYLKKQNAGPKEAQ
ncbi:MAG: FHA domain-containing protein, partial [Candidatus Micrarchaeota archaeon]